jgi:hypothetical protein
MFMSASWNFLRLVRKAENFDPILAMDNLHLLELKLWG